MADIEKAIKGLECCINGRFFNRCPDGCPYFDPNNDGCSNLLKDALALLKGIVRCKDCKQSEMDSVSYPYYWCSAHCELVEGNGFCADGERRTNGA